MSTNPVNHVGLLFLDGSSYGDSCTEYSDTCGEPYQSCVEGVCACLPGLVYVDPDCGKTYWTANKLVVSFNNIVSINRTFEIPDFMLQDPPTLCFVGH